MKKLLIATAIAASISSAASASAVGVVDSNITGVQLWLGQTELLTQGPGGYFSDVRFGGTATDINGDGSVDSANISLRGQIGFIGALQFKVTLNLSNGGFSAGSGINFTNGTIQLDYYADMNPDPEGNPAGVDFQWMPLQTIDASVTNVPFLAGLSAEVSGQTTAGVVRSALPGLWDGQINSVGFNEGVGTFFLLGYTVDMYLQGSIFVSSAVDSETGAPAQMVFGPSAVPIPAAAWLFGSALLGLAGVNRTRRISG